MHLHNRGRAPRLFFIAGLVCGAFAPSLTTAHQPLAQAAGSQQHTAATTAYMHPNTDTILSESPTSGRLYNAPVGYPRGSTFFRDTTLAAVPGTATARPAAVPFSVDLHSTLAPQPVATVPLTSTLSATTSLAESIPLTTTTPLAALTNEGGVTLGVGLATVDGLAPAVQSGQLSGGALTFGCDLVL